MLDLKSKIYYFEGKKYSLTLGSLSTCWLERRRPGSSKKSRVNKLLTPDEKLSAKKRNKEDAKKEMQKISKKKKSEHHRLPMEFKQKISWEKIFAYSRIALNMLA